MQDYAPTPYLIKHVNLDFLLNEDATRVKSLLSVLPNYGSASSPPSLVLDGAPVATCTCVGQQCRSCRNALTGLQFV